MEEEIWKFYTETNNRRWGNRKYEISNYGNVKCNNIPYKPKFKKAGYYYMPDGQRLHRLVALLFIPNPENKPCVDHIDTNVHNNRADNLQWVTHKENSNNPLTKIHHKEAAKKRWENPDYIERTRASHSKYYETHSSAFKNKNHSEESKAKQSKARKEWWEKHKNTKHMNNAINNIK